LLGDYNLNIFNSHIIPLNFLIRKKAFGLQPSATCFLLPASCLLILSLIIINTSKAQSALTDNTALGQFLNNNELRSAHVGVYVYDDSSKKVISDYQSATYFIPASNTKLFSLYAGMKYLGDSLVGIRYFENDTAIFIEPSGDPGLLHPDYQSQPVIDFLKKSNKKIYLVDFGWEETPLGPGWSWDDYNDDYSVERSQLPVYGNFIRWNQQKSETRSNPAFEATATVSSLIEIPWKVRFSKDSLPKTFLVKRLPDSNVFVIRMGNETDITQDVPFITNNLNSAAELLKDTIGKQVYILKPPFPERDVSKVWHTIIYPGPRDSIFSRPADSIFIPMMYRSDNFFAEQTLLMVSRQCLGFMNDEATISSLLNPLLNGPLADLPQKPKWVDGSGLSRYNLFSPQDFVSLLIKFKNEFGMDRMKRILPTGGQGSLKNYYHADSGFVFAKTGSMSGVLCISGYIYTLKKHLLEFSILVNNNIGGGSAIRREVENYIEILRKNN
jgi:D-alanyl-D-alanine carboxypeptidase/D-alanyl-D-alanine-endopeptidase (penicillin-binding protein 4)